MRENFPGSIRQSFHDFLQSRRISITDDHESSVQDALIDAIGTEMMVLQDQIHQKVPASLEDLTWVPNSYRPQERIQVRVWLSFESSEGWVLSRDIDDGGGPYEKGEPGTTVEEAIRNFQEKYQRYER
jgi:hypothetical protein